MKREKLLIHGIAALLFGLRIYLNTEFGARMVFWPQLIGAGCVILGLITILIVLLKVNTQIKTLAYVHSVFLLVLTTIGVVRDLQGADNVLWIFAGSLYALTILDLSRGECDE